MPSRRLWLESRVSPGLSRGAWLSDASAGPQQGRDSAVAVTARKDDAPAAVQASVINVAGCD